MGPYINVACPMPVRASKSLYPISPSRLHDQAPVTGTPGRRAVLLALRRRQPAESSRLRQFGSKLYRSARLVLRYQAYTLVSESK